MALSSRAMVCVDENDEITLYDASDQQSWAASCLKVLTDRFKEGRYSEASKSFQMQVRKIVEDEDIFFTGDNDNRVPKAWVYLKTRSNEGNEGETVYLQEVIRATKVV